MHGLRNSQGNSRPIFRVVDEVPRVLPDAAHGIPAKRNRNRPRGKAQHRSNTLPFQKMTVRSTADVAPSTLHPLPKNSRRQRNEPAAFESNTSTRAVPKPRHLTNGVRSETHQTVHR